MGESSVKGTLLFSWIYSSLSLTCTYSNLNELKACGWVVFSVIYQHFSFIFFFAKPRLIWCDIQLIYRYTWYKKRGIKEKSLSYLFKEFLKQQLPCAESTRLLSLFRSFTDVTLNCYTYYIVVISPSSLLSGRN